MKKQIIIKVENCSKCPYRSRTYKETWLKQFDAKGLHYCDKAKKPIDNIRNPLPKIIPKWCPLENYKEV